MSSVGTKAKNGFNALLMVIIFLITALIIVFAVEVGFNYYDNGTLTYKVAPVTTVMEVVDHFKGNDDKEDVQENTSEKNENTPSSNETQTLSDDNSLQSMVDNVLPSIVAINCKVQTTADQYSFFGGQQSYESTSSGSGIIIAQNSYEVLIATNNHVVDGAKSVEVVFNDDSTYKATIKGTDATSDLAVISVSGNDISDDTMGNIRIASLGNSDNLAVGDTAIAIGNSMGYGQSVTRGVISALNRTVSVEDSTMKLIQTDAAINPGNSGGALLNSKGEVVGINSVKYVSDDIESVGYAIPISTAVPIINELINYEEISEDEQAYFGIVAYTVSEQMTSYFNCSQGAYVKSVTKDSPAEDAGIVAGDIITGFAGRTVTSMEELQELLKYKRGDDECDVTFERLENGQYTEHTVTVKFANKSDFADSSDDIKEND